MIDNNNIAFTWIGFLHCAGLTIEEQEGNLHVKPSSAITPYLADLLKRRKVEIIHAFQSIKETREERAAIIQFDGGMNKATADKAAHNDLMKG